MDFLKIGLQLLTMAVENHTYRDVLSALGRGIQEVSSRISKVKQMDSPDWQDVIVNDECETIENILGAALVVCQTQITAVTCRAMRLTSFGNYPKRSFSAFSNERGIRALSTPLSTASDLPAVEAIWALANYFKHRDEWGEDWEKLSGRPKQTAKVVQMIGLAPGCTCNLQRGATALGNTTLANLEVFADLVDDWALKVSKTCAKEIGL